MKVEDPFSIINFILNLGALGFLISLIKLFNEAKDQRLQLAEEQKKAIEKSLEERIKMISEDSTRKDYWFGKEKESFERERTSNEKEIIRLRELLDKKLKRNNNNSSAHTSEQNMPGNTNGINELIQSLEAKLVDQIRLISSHDPIISESQVTLAKAKEANQYADFDAINVGFYIANGNETWDSYFDKAINISNLRDIPNSNLAAVRACNDSINAMPTDIAPNSKARVFAFRGAVLKRINRLDEAELDLSIAKKYATDENQIDDIYYNLACIYALQGNKEKMLENLNSIKTERSIQYIRNHTSDYFKLYSLDADFNSTLASLSQLIN